MEARGGASTGREACGWIAALLACCALLAAPAAASAATLSIASGADPVEALTTQVGVSGTLDTDHQVVYLTVKPAGGPGCGANFEADSGSSALQREPGPGPYAETVNWTFETAGSYLLCAWISDAAVDGDPVIASTSQTVAVRIPHLSLSIAAPATVLRGRTFQIAMTAQTEAERDVDVELLTDVGRGCPANAQAAYDMSGSTRVFADAITGGPTAETRNETLTASGRYLVCGYVDYGSQLVPEATAVAAIDVVPPCIVPHLGSRTSLRTAKARIVAAHCAVGRIRYVASSRRRGTVLALSPRPGTGHVTHAPVRITVSAGPSRRRRRR